MINCTDLIRSLELYGRGYGDRSSIDRLLQLARRSLDDPRSFAWQRERLSALIAKVEASRRSDQEVEQESFLAAHRMSPIHPGRAPDAGSR
jgi:hypothetical protein